MNKIKRSLWATSLVVLALLLTLVGMSSCTKTEQVPAPSVTPQHPAPPETSPSILGVNANIVTNDSGLTHDVTFSLNQPTYSIAADWAGDIIYYLDVKPPLAAGQSALTADGTYQSTFYSTVSWRNLAPGKHSFSAQLVKPDLTPLDPHVDASIELEVPSPTADSQTLIQSLSIQMLCQPGYTPPGMPGRPQGASACADINVISTVLNFKAFTDKIGQSAAPGEGHFIYYFNITPPTTPGKPALTEVGTYAITADSIASWLGVLPGEYEVWVQLVNNDNTPLDPPMIAGGSIIVPIDAERYD